MYARRLLWEGGEMDPGVAESGPETRPRQPVSEPGSESVDRNVRPRCQTAPGARSGSDSTG